MTQVAKDLEWSGAPHTCHDALELQVAEEENMGSEQSSDILDRVLQALRALNAGPDSEHSPPTKPGGV